MRQLNFDKSSEVAIKARKGDTWSPEIKVKNSTGLLKDLTGYQFTFTLKRRYSDRKAILRLTQGQGVTVTNPGVIRFYVDAEGMTFNAGEYVYDLVAVDAEGKTQTWLWGCFELLERATEL